MQEVNRYYTKPGEAINRYAVRQYELDGRLFQLERCLDMADKDFRLIVIPEASGFSQVVLVNNQEWFCGGESWKKAVPQAFAALAALKGEQCK